MKRLWLISIVIAGLLLAWMITRGKVDTAPLRTMLGLTPVADTSVKSKPICSSPVNPNVAAPTDCIPQHLANLPPDPGPAGMRTIEGIDSDNDGVRDDVQRFIAENYGHSERAVMALRTIAKGVQQQVLVGGDISQDDAKALAEEIVMKPVDCYSLSVNEEIRRRGALDKVVTEVTNTPERFARKRKFEVRAANSVYALSNDSTPELCGYDPAKLPN